MKHNIIWWRGVNGIKYSVWEDIKYSDLKIKSKTSGWFFTQTNNLHCFVQNLSVGSSKLAKFYYSDLVLQYLHFNFLYVQSCLNTISNWSNICSVNWLDFDKMIKSDCDTFFVLTQKNLFKPYIDMTLCSWSYKRSFLRSMIKSHLLKINMLTLHQLLLELEYQCETLGKPSQEKTEHSLFFYKLCSP